MKKTDTVHSVLVFLFYICIMVSYKNGDKVVILDNVAEDIVKINIYSDSNACREIANDLVGKVCTIAVSQSNSNYVLVYECKHIIIPKCSIIHFNEYRKIKIKSILE